MPEFPAVSPSVPPEAAATEGTRRRLLDAAEKFFAEQGFAGASVRQITQYAGANLASVSYHFQSKEGLYQAVFERALSHLRDQRIHAIQQVLEEAVAARRIEPVIRAFVRAFVAPLLDRQRGPQLMKLMMREMQEPQLPEGQMARQLVLPIQEVVVQALQRVCPPMPAADAHYILHAMVGQLVHGLQTWNQMADRSAGSLQPPDWENWMEQVTRFTAGGARALMNPTEESSA